MHCCKGYSCRTCDGVGRGLGVGCAATEAGAGCETGVTGLEYMGSGSELSKEVKDIRAGFGAGVGAGCGCGGGG